MAHKCEVECETILMPASFGTNAVVVLLHEDGGVDAIKVCDACRRKLCTCERCSAFEEQEKDCGRCCAVPPNPGMFFPLVGFGNACRDGWRQARPWTAEEVKGWLGEGE